MSRGSSPVKVKRCVFCGEPFEYKLEKVEMCKKCTKEYHRIYVWTMNHLDYRLSDFADSKEDNDGI